jgi:drug/metabolite transporter (DMT)-like permease
MPVTPSVVSLALVSAVLWGVGPVFSKLGMERGGRSDRATLIVLAVGTATFTLGSLVRGWGGGDTLASVSGTALVAFALSGVFGTSLAWLLWFRGIDRVGASASNVVFYSQPLFAAVLAALALGERLTPGIGVGVVLIVAGVGLLSLSAGDGVGSWRTSALLYPLAAAILAAGSNVVSRFGFRISAVTPLEAATIKQTSALAVLVGYLLISRRRLAGVDTPDLYFTGTGLVNAGALFALLVALDNGPVVVVSPLVGTSPLFTAAFAALLPGDVERVTRRTVASATLTVAGVTAIAVV